MRDRILSAIAILGVALVALILFDFAKTQRAEASTQAGGYKWERELGRHKYTPTTSTALTIPVGTKHAEFHVTGGTAYVRWDGGTAANSAGSGVSWNSFPWPAGHHRKESNDGPKLTSFRMICADCVVWVDYFGDRGVGQ